MISTEEKIVKDYINNISVSDIIKKYGGTDSQIRGILTRHNITKKSLSTRKLRRKWTTEEIEYIKNNFNDMSIHDISNYLDRPYISVATKCSNLGLKRNGNQIRTKENELTDIIQKENLYIKHQNTISIYNMNYKKYNTYKSFLNEENININTCTLRNLINIFDLPKMNFFDKDKYLENYKTCNNYVEMKEILNMSVININKYVKEFNLPKIEIKKTLKRHGKVWTKYQVSLLKQYYKSFTAAECAKLLGRSYESVKSVLKKYKIKK